MRVVVVFKEDSDYARQVLEYLHDFEKQTGHSLETLDPDSVDGEQFCRAYDIVQYPTIIAVSDSAVMQNMWSGLPMPTISELSYYTK